jgi:L-ectoine synthase
MFIRTVREIAGSERDVHGEGWRSLRLVLAGDGLPYSLHESTVDAGQVLRFDYRSHSETVYCIAGGGTVENVASGEVADVRPGTLYSVGVGDGHVLRTDSQTTFLCVFVPPLVGDEEAD